MTTLPPLDKVIAALKIGHKYLGPDAVDLAAAAWLERYIEMCINREEFIAKHNLWEEFSQYLSEPRGAT